VDKVVRNSSEKGLRKITKYLSLQVEIRTRNIMKGCSPVHRNTARWEVGFDGCEPCSVAGFFIRGVEPTVLFSLEFDSPK